ncbi:hypothetical protein Tco_0049510 [Tanacetum coccineum]
MEDETEEEDVVRKSVFKMNITSGAELGPGIPGLQFGFGFGAGYGVGLGFGYGAGRGIAYDENRKHSNVGKLFSGPGSLPTHIFAAIS